MLAGRLGALVSQFEARNEYQVAAARPSVWKMTKEAGRGRPSPSEVKSRVHGASLPHPPRARVLLNLNNKGLFKLNKSAFN